MYILHIYIYTYVYIHILATVLLRRVIIHAKLHNTLGLSYIHVKLGMDKEEPRRPLTHPPPQYYHNLPKDSDGLCSTLKIRTFQNRKSAEVASPDPEHFAMTIVISPLSERQSPRNQTGSVHPESWKSEMVHWVRKRPTSGKVCSLVSRKNCIPQVLGWLKWFMPINSPKWKEIRGPKNSTWHFS